MAHLNIEHLRPNASAPHIKVSDFKSHDFCHICFEHKITRYFVSIFQVNRFYEQWSLAVCRNIQRTKYYVSSIFKIDHLDELSRYGCFYDNRLNFSRQCVKMMIVGTNESNVRFLSQ